MPPSAPTRGFVRAAPDALGRLRPAFMVSFDRASGRYVQTTRTGTLRMIVQTYRLDERGRQLETRTYPYPANAPQRHDAAQGWARRQLAAEAADRHAAHLA